MVHCGICEIGLLANKDQVHWCICTSGPQCINSLWPIVIMRYEKTALLFNSLCHMVLWIFVNFVSGNGLLPHQCQVNPSTNTNLVSSGPLETNCSDILIAIEIQVFSFKKIHSKMWCAKRVPFRPFLNMYMRHKPSALAVGIIAPLC